MVNKNRDEMKVVNDKNKNNEIHYIHSDDFITPNHYIGRENEQEILK